MNIVRENIEFKRGRDPKDTLNLGAFREVENVYFYLLDSGGREIEHFYYPRKYLMDQYNLGFIESIKNKYKELLNREVEYMIITGFDAISKTEKPTTIHIEFTDKNDKSVGYETQEALEKLIL